MNDECEHDWQPMSEEDAIAVLREHYINADGHDDCPLCEAWLELHAGTIAYEGPK